MDAKEAALREAIELIEGDKVGLEWKQGCWDFIKRAKAALRAQGEPAPVQESEWQPIETAPKDMTLRDYFATRAMQSMLTDAGSVQYFDRIAQNAYKLADAMLEAREQKEPQVHRAREMLPGEPTAREALDWVLDKIKESGVGMAQLSAMVTAKRDSLPESASE